MSKDSVDILIYFVLYYAVFCVVYLFLVCLMAVILRWVFDIQLICQYLKFICNEKETTNYLLTKIAQNTQATEEVIKSLKVIHSPSQLDDYSKKMQMLILE